MTSGGTVNVVSADVMAPVTIPVSTNPVKVHAIDTSRPEKLRGEISPYLDKLAEGVQHYFQTIYNKNYMSNDINVSKMKLCYLDIPSHNIVQLQTGISGTEYL